MSARTTVVAPFSQRMHESGAQTTRVTGSNTGTYSNENSQPNTARVIRQPTPPQSYHSQHSTYDHPSSSLFGEGAGAAAVATNSSLPSLSSTSASPYSLRLPTQPHVSDSTSLFNSTAAASAPATPAATHSRFFYKLVAKVGQRYVSIFDGQTEYVIGQTMRTIVKAAPPGTARSWTPRRLSDQTRGGFFVCRSAEAALESRLPENSALFCAPRALIKVLAWGESINYGSTIAFSHVRPVQVFPLSLSNLNTAFSQRTVTSVKLNETRKMLPPFHGPQRRMLPAFRERESMGKLTREIMSMDREINDLTRRSLM